MRIGIPAETRAGETRVAATPETVKKMLAAGHQVLVQQGAGAGASIPDAEFQAAGATLVGASELYAQAEIVLKVKAPSAAELGQMKAGTVLIGLLSPHQADQVAAYAKQGITAFPMEKLLRTTRAQAMDVLSSQANIAGYKAVLVGANLYKRFMPMLMTAAGTVKAARVVILGVGVAGLQAIAKHGDVAAQQRLDDKIRYHLTIVRVHARPVGVEDPCDFDGQLLLAPIVEEQGFRAAVALVVTGARANRIDVPPIVLTLRMHVGIVSEVEACSILARRRLASPNTLMAPCTLVLVVCTGSCR